MCNFEFRHKKLFEFENPSIDGGLTTGLPLILVIYVWNMVRNFRIWCEVFKEKL